jgi:hypothetical protein
MRTFTTMSIHFQRELVKLIDQITGVLQDEEANIEEELRKWNMFDGDIIERLAKVAELKIRKKQNKKIRKQVAEILRGSTNKLILATIGKADN